MRHKGISFSPRKSFFSLASFDRGSLDAAALCIMGRGYLDFELLYAMHQRSAFFVTGAKPKVYARRMHAAKMNKAIGVACHHHPR